MGCVESQPDVNNMQSTVFQVLVMEENCQRQQCQRQQSACLEVTDTSIIVYNKNKTSTQWPLSCLRLYGFDGDIFSFESGRRCITGPGVYKYKCRRAEALFMLLQLKIQGIAEQAVAHDFTSLLSHGYLSPITVNNRIRSDSIPAIGSSNNVPMQSLRIANIPSPLQNSTSSNILNTQVSSHTAVHPVSETFHTNSAAVSQTTVVQTHTSNSMLAQTIVPQEAMNAEDRGSSAPPLTPVPDNVIASSDQLWTNRNERRAPSLSSPINISQTLNPHLQSLCTDNYFDNASNIPEATGHVYMNIMSDCSRRESDRLHVGNIALEKEIPVVIPRLSIAATSVESSSFNVGTTTTTDTTQQMSLNYIIVDLDKGADSSHIHRVSHYSSSTSGLSESPPSKTATEQYSLIDFERTEALLNAKKMVDYRATCGRNNSTLSTDCIPPPRHKSSYSE